ncbi:hypothetical protein Tco_0971142 [Tanacetum coccineum]
MLNKDNYVPWSSRLLRYAKSKPNGKLLVNSIKNGPYVRRMIHEPGDPNSIPHVAESTLEQTNDELTEKEAKQMEASDQDIKTILMGLPEDIYAALLNGNDMSLLFIKQRICMKLTTSSEIDEIKEFNANCILMENLQQALTSGTQTDKAPVYNSDGSTDVHHYENYYDNDIFNMFTQEEQYTELLEPITEPHTVQQNNSNVISMESSVEHNRGILSKEKTIVSYLQEERKKFQDDFKTREDEFLDKLIQYQKKIKELDNILVKKGQSIQTMYMLSPKLDSFYHTEQDMALGYQNPFYLKKAQ